MAKHTHNNVKVLKNVIHDSNRDRERTVIIQIFLCRDITRFHNQTLELPVYKYHEIVYKQSPIYIYLYSLKEWGRHGLLDEWMMKSLEEARMAAPFSKY